MNSILDGTAPARLVLVYDTLAAPARPVVSELLARAAERGQRTLCVGLLPNCPGAEVLDLSRAVVGYSDEDVEMAIREKCAALDPTCQVYIDAADVLAEDAGVAAAFRILRAILAKLQSPGRLILSLPPGAFATDVQAATLSPSLALLTPHAPRALESTARALLLPPTDDRFWHHLAPGQGDALALRGADGVDVNPADEYAVQVLIRKATGGAKGMLRSLDGLRRTGGRWDAVPLDQVVNVSPLANTKTTTHADLALPFNLSLTDRQRAERGAVPLPYAHEGEGADLGMGMDWSDDEEDDEI